MSNPCSNLMTITCVAHLRAATGRTFLLRTAPTGLVFSVVPDSAAAVAAADDVVVVSSACSVASAGVEKFLGLSSPCLTYSPGLWFLSPVSV